MLPGTKPIALLIDAVTGGTPNAISAGKVINVPDPTTVLMVPAPTPASRTRNASVNVTSAPYGLNRPAFRGADLSLSPTGKHPGSVRLRNWPAHPTHQPAGAAGACEADRPSAVCLLCRSSPIRSLSA